MIENTKQEITDRFDSECKQQGGSAEAIHRAFYRAMIDIECDKRGLLKSLFDQIKDIVHHER